MGRESGCKRQAELLLTFERRSPSGVAGIVLQNKDHCVEWALAEAVSPLVLCAVAEAMIILRDDPLGSELLAAAQLLVRSVL